MKAVAIKPPKGKDQDSNYSNYTVDPVGRVEYGYVQSMVLLWLWNINSVDIAAWAGLQYVICSHKI